MCPNDMMHLPRRFYLIVLDDALVTQDLSETLAAHDPAAGVVTCRSLDEAAATLQSVEAIEVAFIEAGPERFAASPLAEILAAKGGRVVFMGDEAEDAAEASGQVVLGRPFTPPMVLAHLRGPVAP